MYEVDSASENLYRVDIHKGTCSCPDHQKRGVECKHLRRVLFAIKTRTVPKPNGRFVTCAEETEGVGWQSN
ncbi:SWIM zinc finger family protein (plasmid) [Haloferax sp. S1W]|uniref:SWIM zinc finger family protein n=1 Tax=Haloferax sp. S1W TaxID=3377110 RepID=UPI0037C971CC